LQNLVANMYATFHAKNLTICRNAVLTVSNYGELKMADCLNESVNAEGIFTIILDGDGDKYYRLWGIIWSEQMFNFQLFIWILCLLLLAVFIRKTWRDFSWGLSLQLIYNLSFYLWFFVASLAFVNASYNLPRKFLLLSHEGSIGVALAIWGMMLGWVLFKASTNPKT